MAAMDEIDIETLNNAGEQHAVLRNQGAVTLRQGTGCNSTINGNILEL